jgi:hypothetical protein
MWDTACCRQGHKESVRGVGRGLASWEAEQLAAAAGVPGATSSAPEPTTRASRCVNEWTGEGGGALGMADAEYISHASAARKPCAVAWPARSRPPQICSLSTCHCHCCSHSCCCCCCCCCSRHLCPAGALHAVQCSLVWSRHDLQPAAAVHPQQH